MRPRREYVARVFIKRKKIQRIGKSRRVHSPVWRVPACRDGCGAAVRAARYLRGNPEHILLFSMGAQSYFRARDYQGTHNAWHNFRPACVRGCTASACLLRSCRCCTIRCGCGFAGVLWCAQGRLPLREVGSTGSHANPWQRHMLHRLRPAFLRLSQCCLCFGRRASATQPCHPASGCCLQCQPHAIAGFNDGSRLGPRLPCWILAATSCGHHAPYLSPHRVLVDLAHRHLAMAVDSPSPTIRIAFDGAREAVAVSPIIPASHRAR